MTPINIRKGDGIPRTLVNVRFHPSSSKIQPIFEGESLASGETVIFLPKHIIRVRRVDNGPTLRPTGIKYAPPENKAQEREYFNALDEINELTVLLRNQEREA